MEPTHDFLAALSNDERAARLRDIRNRFEYARPPAERPDVAKAHEAINLALHRIAVMAATTVPPGRELSLCLTKLEEARSWANAGIAHNHQAFPLVSGD